MRKVSRKLKLKIKLPLLFLLMLVTLAFLLVIIRLNMLDKAFPSYKNYAADNQQIADQVAALYPDRKGIAAYLRRISNTQKVSVKLYNQDASTVLVSYLKPHDDDETLKNYWVPVRTAQRRLVFFLEIMRSRQLASNSKAQLMLFLWLLLFLIAAIFAALAVYFHFSITRPIQTLNSRLKSVNIGHSFTTLYSKRKDEIGELYHNFNEMQERLHQAHREQVGMIAAIAHDLRTPLTTINGFVELLTLQKDLSERDKQEYYELILKKSKHMVDLICYFLAFTREELELEAIEKQASPVLELFESIVAEYETELSGLNYRLDWSHSFKPSQYVMINGSMIRRVFGNLFSNALRYGAKDGLQIYLSGYAKGDYAHFQVEDNGMGVPEEDLSSLFQKFFTVDKSRKNRSGGTGLGLASCKSIIEHHGGQISAFHSQYGGLGIRFTIPLI
jgi:signal transduction histidine kinase